MNYFKNVVLTILIFLGSQLIVAVALSSLSPLFHWSNTVLLGLSLLLADIVACPIVHFFLHTTEPRYLLHAAFPKTPLSKWRGEALIFAGAIIGIFGMNLLQDQLDLPNPTIEQIVELAFNPLGVISICLAGPICEEFIFRDGIQGYLMRNGLGPWKAILISSFCFAFVHMNAAQIPFALVVGIIMGIAYWKTGNLLLCTLIHIINNFISVMMLWINGKESAYDSMSEMIGGTTVSWTLFSLSIIACALLFLYICKQKSLGETVEA